MAGKRRKRAFTDVISNRLSGKIRLTTGQQPGTK